MNGDHRRRDPGSRCRRTVAVAFGLAALFASTAVMVGGVSGTAVAQTTRPGSPRVVGAPTNVRSAPAVEPDRPGLLDLPGGPVVDSLYVVGPGDRFLLGEPGGDPQFVELVVDLEGNLAVPGLGVFPVSGVSLDAARARLLSEIRRLRPRAELNLTLIEARRFRVYLLGQLSTPGSYPANGLDRVSDLIDRVGNLKGTASKRRITRFGTGGDTMRVDLLRFQLLGDARLNPYLRDGDRIVVPYAGRSVEIFGAVHDPGAFEFVDGERVSGLIELAGGLLPNALPDSIRLVRPGRVEGTEVEIRFDFPQSDPALRARDQVFIRTDPNYDRGPVVTLEGEFVYPMVLPIREGETRVRDVILAAGGFTAEAAIDEAALIRTQRGEQLQDLEYERLKQLPVADMRETEYQYFKMKSRERPGKMQVDFRAVLADSNHADNIPLARGDLITVPRLSEYIQVSGQVANPGAVRFEPGLRVSDYVERAGGYSWNARKSRLTLIRATTGEWIRNPGDSDMPQPGDVVWVPEKPDRDYWGIFKDTMLVAGQVATVVLLAREVTR